MQNETLVFHSAVASESISGERVGGGPRTPASSPELHVAPSLVASRSYGRRRLWDSFKDWRDRPLHWNHFSSCVYSYITRTYLALGQTKHLCLAISDYIVSFFFNCVRMSEAMNNVLSRTQALSNVDPTDYQIVLIIADILHSHSLNL